MRYRSPLRDLNTVGIVATNGPDYLRRILTILAEGAVAVPLRSAEDKERLQRTATTNVVFPKVGSGWLDGSFDTQVNSSPAQISFTSGTTGPAKAVLLSHGNLRDVVDRLSISMEISEDIREYIGAPIYHSFGYARGRAALAAKGKAFVPESFDLTQIRSMLEENSINAISAVPSQWRLVLRNLDLFEGLLQKIKWAEIGSQPMSDSEKASLRMALPEARIVQHYGMTEASRTSLLRVDQVPEDRLDSVGRAEGSVQIRISPKGLIETRGPHVALGVDDGQMWHPLGPDVWLNTGDLGRMDNGWLYFEGRADDIINCAGIKLSPDQLELRVRQALPNAGDFAILRRADSLRGDGILVVRSPKAAPASELRAAVEDAASESGLSAAGAIEIRDLDRIPRTETGKARRVALVEAISSAPIAQIDPSPAIVGFAEEIADILGSEPLKAHASFHSCGGDSLLHMQMTLALERVFGRPPSDWESQPLPELARKADLHIITNGTHAKSGLPPLPDGTTNQNPKDISFWSLVYEDFLTNDASLTHQGFLTLFVHRFGNWRMGVHPRLFRLPLSLLYRFLNKATQLLFGIKLDYTVKVGRRVKLEHFGGMILGAREIGNDTILRQNTTLGIRSTDEIRAKPIIGSFVDIGAGAVIVGDVRVGDNSIIGANTVVYMNVPPNSVVVGVPGKIVGQNHRQNPSPLASKENIS